jgi:long-subunit fatty acid transport protein
VTGLRFAAWSLSLGLMHLGSGAAAQTLEDAASATALALAGAGSTVVRDPTALWGNPALISETSRGVLVGLRLQSMTRAIQRITVNPLPEARDTTGVQLAPSIALALPVWRSHIWVGVGYHMALQVDSRYPHEILGSDPGTSADRQASARYRGLESGLEQHLVSLGVAARYRWLALGAALELSHVRFHHRMALWAGYEADRQNARFEVPQLDTDALLDGTNRLAVGARFGVWLHPLRWLVAGVALSLPATAEIAGNVVLTTGTSWPRDYTGITAQGGSAQVDLRLPLQLRGGVALGPPRLRLVLEGTLTRWSADDNVSARLQDAGFVLTQRSGPDKIVPFDTLPLAIELRDSFSVHAGLELVPWPGFLTVRTGYAYHRGATQPEAPSSTILDLDRHTWAIGLEATHGRLRLSVAVAQSFEETLQTAAERAVLANPLAPAVTASVGEGQYTTSSLQVLLELQVGF